MRHWLDQLPRQAPVKLKSGQNGCVEKLDVSQNHVVVGEDFQAKFAAFLSSPAVAARLPIPKNVVFHAQSLRPEFHFPIH
jgi:hypothetical protein